MRAPHPTAPARPPALPAAPPHSRSSRLTHRPPRCTPGEPRTWTYATSSGAAESLENFRYLRPGVAAGQLKDWESGVHFFDGLGAVAAFLGVHATPGAHAATAAAATVVSLVFVLTPHHAPPRAPPCPRVQDDSFVGEDEAVHVLQPAGTAGATATALRRSRTAKLRDTPTHPLVNTAVRKSFPGVGDWAGSVTECTDAAQGKFTVQWTDGSTSTLRRADLDRAARAYTEHGEPDQTGGLYVVEEEGGSGSGSTGGGDGGGGDGGGGGGGARKRSHPRCTAPTEEAARGGGGGGGGGGGARKRLRPSGRTAMTALPAEGDDLQVYWDENRKWYLATVVAHNAETGVHTLRYRDGGETEEVDLSAAAEKVTWLQA